MLLFMIPQAPPPQPSSVQFQALDLDLPAALKTLIQKKDWAGAADWFESVPPPVRGRHYELWIQSLNRSQRWERLLEVCDALQSQLEARTGPRLATYRLYRAQALSKLGIHEEAATANMENWRLGYADGFHNACVEAAQKQDWAHILEWSDESLTRQPTQVEAMAWKGEALIQLGQLLEAELLLIALTESQPQSALAWNRFGHCLIAQKNWVRGIEVLSRALTLDPKLSDALQNRGTAFFQLKRYQESVSDFRGALELRPGDSTLTENLRQAERYAAALEEFVAKRSKASRPSK